MPVMSNVHTLPGVTPLPKTRVRGSYRKVATKAEITRAIRAAEELGLTVYGFTVDGGSIQVSTRPTSAAPASEEAVVDDWFSRHG